MITRDALARYVDDYLGCNRFNDYAPNGIQVEGKPEIYRICTAVTASLAALEEAAALKADALLVHHGYFWRNDEPVITGMHRQRVARLLAGDISLFAWHLPLDCHPETGNNACLGSLLKLDKVQTHTAGRVDGLLWSGEWETPVTPKELFGVLDNTLHRMPLHIPGGGQHISRIAWCTGAAQDFIVEAHRLGVDAYLSGEVSERTWYQAMELGIHYYACGHHATERYGIQALGRHLAERFELEHRFIDSGNPV